MKYAIISYYFYPENTPRAFRAYELTKELIKRGHEVIVIIPDYCYSYDSISELDGVNFIKINNLNKAISNNISNNDSPFNSSKLKILVTSSILYKALKGFIKYFFGIEIKNIFEFFSLKLYKQIKQTLQVDKVISIGLPFSCHFGTYLLLKSHKLTATTVIADYGDPFTSNIASNLAPYFKYIEKTVLDCFNYITIPIEEAKIGYLDLVPEEKIRVIPQGYDFSAVKLEEYKEIDIVSFSYAGIFYENVRNPLNFLTFLNSINKDFRFYIYTDIDSMLKIKGIRAVISQLGEKIILKNMIERNECIRELSKMDFLVNQHNQSNIQKPSKLIDYGLTKRPIFEYSQDKIDEEKFLKFLDRDYKLSPIYEIEQYDIKNITQKFELL